MKEPNQEEHCLQTTFMMAAKSNVGMVRDNNEDNFQVSSDLDNSMMQWRNNELCQLSNRGALLVVADGMGGMNAGEVASEIAIDTVRDCFKPELITDEVVKTRYTIERFMNSVITEADNRIKQTARQRPETKGMGTTMVMGWIFGENLYVSWCGDSRAYVFNPRKGLKRLSKDHSLVQQLVDSGKISKEDAFDYPDSNVITNSLCAVDQIAVPEALTMPHRLEKDDVVLLCSDGLCGLIRDAEIQDIMAQNPENMEQCCDTLIKAACDAGGHDNVTVALCRMVTVKDSDSDALVAPTNTGRKTWLKWGGIAIAALLLGLCVYWFGFRNKPIAEEQTDVADTIPPIADDSSQIEEVKVKKVWKYVYKTADTTDTDVVTDCITAELKKNPKTQLNDLFITAKFLANQKSDYHFATFKYKTQDTIIYGNLVNDEETPSRNYKVSFSKNKFDNNTITGIMVDDKTRDTVFLFNVPLTRNATIWERSGRNNREDNNGTNPIPSQPDGNSSNNPDGVNPPTDEHETGNNSQIQGTIDDSILTLHQNPNNQ